MLSRPITLGFVLAWLIIAPAPQASAAVKEIETSHRGIALTAIARPVDQFTTEIIAAKPAIGKLKSAIDLIRARSPFSWRRIETLKKNGQVIIVYDPAFPKRELSRVKIAAFFPDFFQKASDGLKRFYVVVGRYGAKWPIDELAAVVVHELVGHGLQHLRGRGTHDRKIDRECEAQIYEERAYQDLGMPRNTDQMIRFRRGLRRHWCSDFGRYLTEQGLNSDKEWGFGNPDVPRLLKRFDAYIAHLRTSGVSGRAVAAEKARKAKKFKAFAARAEKRQSAPDMLKVGKRYLKGIGIKKNPPLGARWVLRAAELGSTEALHVLGILHYNGEGVKRNLIESYKWFTLAIKRGFQASTALRSERVTPRLSPEQITNAKHRAAAWAAKGRG